MADPFEPIAIIGMSCRLPQAESPRAYWELLAQGKDAVGELPSSRWDVDAYYSPDPKVPGKMVTRRGAFLASPSAVDGHDAGFFRLAPAEAARMDPQQHLLLELAWEALEDAGLVPASLAKSRTGVFIGIANSDHGRQVLSDPAIDDPYAASSSLLSIAANRLSYFFDLRGPSVAVDTACSSSLVALHQACQSLRLGETQLALVGGVSLVLSPAGSIAFSKVGVLAPDGKCRAFDAKAGGYGRGEGGGMLVLKPLEQARAHGDPIQAVIRGTAVNANGRSNGLSSPSFEAQVELLRSACEVAQVAPESVQYVEAQGIGTPLGDAIEANALVAAYGQQRPPDRPLWVGSVKTNLGHLDAASGVASLIKVVLAMKRGAIPPTLHFEQFNPQIAEPTRLRVPTATTAWPVAGPKRAGVSAFGFGGVNAHVLLEGAEESLPSALAQSDTHRERPHVLLVSARSEGALTALAQSYRQRLDDEASSLNDLCFTAATRRSHHPHRLAILGATHGALRQGLDDFLAGRSTPRVFSGKKSLSKRFRIVLSFPSRPRDVPPSRVEPSADAAALAGYPAAHATWAHASTLAEELLSGQAREGQRPPLPQAVSHSLAQWSLAALLHHLGLAPAVVVGDGFGRLVAAVVAGTLELRDALEVLLCRAQAEAGGESSPEQRARLKGLLQALRPRASAVAVRSGMPSDGNAAFVPEPNDVVLELSAPTGDQVREAALPRARQLWLPLPSAEVPDAEERFLSTVAALHVEGLDLDWTALYPSGQCVWLPSNPWQRTPRPQRQPSSEPPAVRRPSAPAAPAAPLQRQGTTSATGPGRLARLLGRAEPLEPEATLAELGVDSLAATQLIDRIQQELGCALSVVDFGGTRTVRELEQKLVELAAVGKSRSAPTDLPARPSLAKLTADAQLGPAIGPAPKPDAPSTTLDAAPRAVLLTGATGFLGAFVLAELLEATQARVLCLVRARNSGEGQKRLRQALESYGLWNAAWAARIEAVPGDLAKPLLGQTAGRLKQLGDELDAIYHVGAEVNFLDGYEALRPANVLGTRELLRLSSLRRPKVFHHVSSTYAIVLPESDELALAEGPPPEDGSLLPLGYQQTKWVAERLVLEARERGLPVALYRPALVTGHSKTGASNRADFLWALLQGCLELGMAPDVEATLPLTPVDFVARALVRLSLSPASTGGIFHLSNPAPTSWRELLELFGQVGHPVRRVPVAEWKAELQRAGPRSGLWPFLKSSNAESLFGTMLVRQPYFDVRRTMEGLSGTGIECPRIDAHLLRTYAGQLAPPALEAPPPSAATGA